MCWCREGGVCREGMCVGVGRGCVCVGRVCVLV